MANLFQQLGSGGTSLGDLVIRTVANEFIKSIFDDSISPQQQLSIARTSNRVASMNDGEGDTLNQLKIMAENLGKKTNNAYLKGVDEGDAIIKDFTDGLDAFITSEGSYQYLDRNTGDYESAQSPYVKDMANLLRNQVSLFQDASRGKAKTRDMMGDALNQWHDIKKNPQELIKYGAEGAGSVGTLEGLIEKFSKVQQRNSDKDTQVYGDMSFFNKNVADLSTLLKAKHHAERLDTDPGEVGIQLHKDLLKTDAPLFTVFEDDAELQGILQKANIAAMDMHGNVVENWQGQRGVKFKDAAAAIDNFIQAGNYEAANLLAMKMIPGTSNKVVQKNIATTLLKAKKDGYIEHENNFSSAINSSLANIDMDLKSGLGSGKNRGRYYTDDEGIRVFGIDLPFEKKDTNNPMSLTFHQGLVSTVNSLHGYKKSTSNSYGNLAERVEKNNIHVGRNIVNLLAYGSGGAIIHDGKTYTVTGKHKGKSVNTISDMSYPVLKDILTNGYGAKDTQGNPSLSIRTLLGDDINSQNAWNTFTFDAENEKISAFDEESNNYKYEHRAVEGLIRHFKTQDEYIESESVFKKELSKAISINKSIDSGEDLNLETMKGAKTPPAKVKIDEGAIDKDGNLVDPSFLKDLDLIAPIRGTREQAQLQAAETLGARADLEIFKAGTDIDEQLSALNRLQEEAIKGGYSSTSTGLKDSPYISDIKSHLQTEKTLLDGFIEDAREMKKLPAWSLNTNIFGGTSRGKYHEANLLIDDLVQNAERSDNYNPYLFDKAQKIADHQAQLTKEERAPMLRWGRQVTGMKQAKETGDRTSKYLTPNALYQMDYDDILEMLNKQDPHGTTMAKLDELTALADKEKLELGVLLGTDKASEVVDKIWDNYEGRGRSLTDIREETERLLNTL